MKRHINKILLVLVISVPMSVWADRNECFLDVILCGQEQTEWCWAATSQCVLDYYGYSYTQTEIADYGTEGVNTWNWIWGQSSNPTRRGIDMILMNFGRIETDRYPRSLTLTEIDTELCSYQPFVFRWGWTGGGGHFLVGHGIDNSNNVYYMDPLPVGQGGFHIADYDWVVSGSGHDWTHTLTTNQDEGNDQYFVTLEPNTLYLQQDCFQILDYTFCVWGLNPNYVTIIDPDNDYETIYSEHIRNWSNYNLAIFCDGINTIGDLGAYLGGGPASNAGPVFQDTEVTGAPGDEVYFEAVVPLSPEYLFSNNTSDYSVYILGDDDNIYGDWISDVDTFDGDTRVRIYFNIPSDAQDESRVFYVMNQFLGSEHKYLTRLTLTITAPDWVDVATGPVADNGANTAVAWGDFTADGYDDLYLVKEVGSNTLLINDGSGGFDVCTAAVVADPGMGTDASWGDYDQDGDLDLFLANSDGPNRLYRNDGPGGDCWQFTEITMNDIPDGSEAIAASWIDFDHDGALDIYVSNRDGANLLLHGSLNFLNQLPPELDFAVASQGFAWLDYDLDADQDLYLVTESGSHYLYEQVSPIEFVSHSVMVSSSSGGQGCTWGDYDNDGDFDLYVTHWSAPNLLLENQDAAMVEISMPVLENDGQSQSAVWGDYDNDGYLDLYLANFDHPNMLFHNEAGAGFTLVDDPILADGSQSVGAAWSDYDRDGDLDIYVCNYGGANRLFHNNLHNDNNWLEVKLRGIDQGSQTNRSAIGALVKVEANGLVLWRCVSGGSGYASQNSQVQHFGLGQISTVDKITVIWPWRVYASSHHTTVLEDVAVNQILTIIEEASSPSSIGDGNTIPVAFALHAAQPNPFNPMTMIGYDLPREAPVQLAIYDLTGRLVRMLCSGEVESAGKHEVIWDGQNEHDQQVATGVYLYRLRAGDFTATQRMTLLK